MTGPELAFSEELHAGKYRGEGESFREGANRCASALQDDDQHYHDFRNILMDMRFMPGGRVQAAMGSTKLITPYNCFVSGTIEDSFVDGHGSIMQRAKEAAETMRMGGGIGYDFSTLRPRGSMIKKLQSQSSGPISFMDIYNAICLCVASSGHRRGAQMGILRIDHPDIEEFIHAKQPPPEAEPVLRMLEEAEPDSDEYRHWHAVLQKLLYMSGFNTSIAVTDEFMECLAEDRPFKLQWEGEVYREVDPGALWEMIMRSTWDWGEPGVIFIDTINRMNNLYYCETIAATNPCAEQPLPPYGACLLGSFNLVKYIHTNPTNGSRTFDWELFELEIPTVVRAMDNVVDRARYPLYEQEKEAQSKRRMGLGVTGLANALEALGLPYGSQGFLEMEDKILARLTEVSYLASAELAGEKGAFPLYDPQHYLNGAFIKTLPAHVQEAIRSNGIRNSHLISIAPTGTISLCADNISSGIEPVYKYEFERIVEEFEGPRVEVVTDYGKRVFGVDGRRCAEVTVKEHLDVLSVAYRHVDSAVSKTCNVPGDVGWEDFKRVYITAWETGCKGCTTFRDEGLRSGVLRSVKDSDEESTVVAFTGTNDGAACGIDSMTGRHECE